MRTARIRTVLFAQCLVKTVTTAQSGNAPESRGQLRHVAPLLRVLLTIIMLFGLRNHRCRHLDGGRGGFISLQCAPGCGKKQNSKGSRTRNCCSHRPFGFRASRRAPEEMVCCLRNWGELRLDFSATCRDSEALDAHHSPSSPGNFAGVSERFPFDGLPSYSSQVVECTHEARVQKPCRDLSSRSLGLESELKPRALLS